MRKLVFFLTMGLDEHTIREKAVVLISTTATLPRQGNTELSSSHLTRAFQNLPKLACAHYIAPGHPAFRPEPRQAKLDLNAT